MACDPEILKNVPPFALLDSEEIAVLATQVELRTFSARERIYKKEQPGGQAYVLLSGQVRVTTVDEDQQEVIVDEPSAGEFFGFASMLEQTAHHTGAITIDETRCVEVSRDDIAVLLQRKSLAGMDLLTALSRQLHAAQDLVGTRAARNPNDMIEEESTLGERIADQVARFGGSWTFIITFGVLMSLYTGANLLLGKKTWDPYPLILLNLFLSALAAIQAHVIMMSQNRQDTKGRLRGELDLDVNKRSMRLEGLDPTNINALSRAIVVHSAWYVNKRVIGAYGVLGRSQGCFAVADASLPEITDRLGPGRLIYAGKAQALRRGGVRCRQ